MNCLTASARGARILILTVLLLFVAAGGAFAGPNNYSSFTSAGGPLTADGSQQTVATLNSAQSGGGATVTSFTILLGGTVSAGDVTGVYFTNGTNTWSATGSYGSGSSVVCNGSAKPGASTYSINVTLAGSAAGKTVSVQVTAETPASGGTGIPTATSSALSISAPPASNSYGSMTSEAGPLSADLSQQLVASVPVTNVSGGLAVSSYTVDITGTVVAGDVTGVYVTDGTSTWSSTGSYGNGSSVFCTGSNAIPGATLSIKVTLAASADTQTVAVTLQTDSNTAATLPKGPSTALSIVASGPSNSLTSCAGCHDYPPADSGGGRGVPEGAVVGDHSKHGYTCNYCHVVPADETSANFAHRDGNINMKNGTIGDAGTGDNGSYNKGTGGVFAQSNTPTLATCSNVDCHYNNPTPAWGDPIGTTCESCHFAPPPSGAHYAHYAAKSAQGWNNPDDTGANCSTCHPGDHDGLIEVNAALTYGAGRCYSPGGPGCHNDYETPNWTTGNAVCTDCHTAGGVNAADPSSGLHATNNLTDHDNTLQSGNCVNCHSSTSPSDSHWDGTFQNGGAATFTWNTTNIPAGYDRTNDYCAANCHADSGTWNREWSGVVDVAWTYSDDPSVATVCGNCHGSFLTGWNIIGNTSHDNPATVNDPTTLADVAGSHNTCSTCHAWGHANYSTGTKHKNNLLEMNSTVDTTPGDGDCTTNCHSGQTLTMVANSGWTDASVAGDGVTCGGCHTDGVQVGSASATHIAHNATQADLVAGGPWPDCVQCHPNVDYDSAHSGALQFDATKVTYSGGENGTCSTASCHNKGAEQSNAWDSAVQLECNDCHYYEATVASNANNATHASPLSNRHDSHFNKGKQCSLCHTVPSAGDTSHIDGATSLADKATASFSEATVGGSKGITYGYPNCTAGFGGVGCHATATSEAWNQASGTIVCTDCHTDTSTATVNPTSGLHAVTNITKHDATLQSGNCVNCHDATTPTSLHQNGTLDSYGTGTWNFNANVYSYDATGCAASCHSDGAWGSAKAWKRRWNGVANVVPVVGTHNPGDPVCGNCHGDFSNGWNLNEAETTIANHTNPDPDNSGGTSGDYMGFAGGSHEDCKQCHAWGDAAYTGAQHNNGNITMNGDTSDSTGSEYDRTTGGCASNCHGALDLTMRFNTQWANDWVDGPAGGCAGCHDTGSGGAPVVSATSSHVDADGASATYAAGTCTDCHTGHADGTTGVNDVEISTDVPAMFATRPYTSHATGFIQLGGGATAGYAKSTEAELCWACHDANGISEWGKTWGAYQTGNLGGNSNWKTATWQSANFSYKTKAISSLHSTKNMVGKSADGFTARTISGETVGDISCTYCHDVHKVGKHGTAPTAAPYLRGTWTSNVYKEDGAPGWGHTTWVEGDSRGVVPRAAALLGVANNNELGGWQIEQNNGRNDSAQTYANFGGLCNKCHTDVGIKNKWAPHGAVVAGFTGTANDIFDVSNRGGDGTYQRGHIINAGTTDTRGQAAGKSGYIGALRNSNQWSDGISPPAGKPQVSPLPNPSFAAGAVTTLNVTSGGSLQTNFHNFMCSKCHQPHASRLPRLMITNCLDVNHNNWDDTAAFDPSSWTPGTFNAGDLAYSPTAGNCHRYVDGGDANSETGAQESGWNLVTPWDQATGLPFN